MIHIIGDSHALTFEDAKDVEIHWMGAATAHNLWKKNKHILSIIESNPKDKYFFCLGEIDCRIHIYNKSVSTGVPEYILSWITVYTYTSYISSLRNYNVSIMAVPPQGLQDNYFNYPFYATRKHRQEITDYFNMVLEGEAHRNRIPFVDIWYNKAEIVRPLLDSRHFQEDKCHIKSKFAIEKLEKYFDKRY
jgi:hypothetical protein